MSAIRRGMGEGARACIGECARCEAVTVREIAANKATSAHRHVYPLLMIGGVYRASFAMGLAVYVLPACVPSTSASTSRHRARASVRRARHALRQKLTEPGADVSPRHHHP